MSHTTWPGITDVQQLVGIMGGTLHTSADTVFQEAVLDSIIATVGRKTRRTFISTTETRYYDGNDKGEIEIDEFLTLSTIELIGWFGVTQGLSLQNFVPVVRVGFPNTRVQIYRGSVPAFYRHWVDRFPRGRGNLAITGDWGYATTVPDDLWFGVMAQAAAMHLNHQLFNNAEAGKGFLIKWTEAEVQEVRDTKTDPFRFLGLPLRFNELLELYKKPSGMYFRKRSTPIV